MPKYLLILLVIFFANGCINEKSKNVNSYKSQGDSNYLNQYSQENTQDSKTNDDKNSSNTNSEQNRDNNQTKNNHQNSSDSNSTNQDNKENNSDNNNSNQESNTTNDNSNSNNNQDNNSSNKNSNSNSEENNSSNDNSNQEDNKTTEQNTPPTAIATATPNSVTEGEEITFDASNSSDSDGEIVKYEWFEYTTKLSNSKIFTKSDFKVGKHTIKLIITDDDNLTATTSTTIEVKSNTPKIVYLKKSGQTTVFEKNDDGDYQIGFDFSYERDDDNNIVIDNVTNLEWQDDEESVKLAKNWEDAKSYCNDLKFANRDDWRLPTRAELYAILDFSKKSNLFSETFKNSSGEGYYWSATSYVQDSSKAWYLYSVDGYQGVDSKTNQFAVRCVRDKK